MKGRDGLIEPMEMAKKFGKTICKIMLDVLIEKRSDCTKQEQKTTQESRKN